MADFDFVSAPQIVGYFAFLFGVMALFQTKDIHLKTLLIVHSVLYAAHFFLLGELAAVCGCVIAIFRISLSIFTRSWLVVALLICASLLCAPFAGQYWYAILPILASCILTIGLFRFSGVPMRLFILAGSMLWLIHNIAAGSIGGTALEALMLASNMVAIMRIRGVGIIHR